MEHEEILSFMDLLDLDEEMIDSRLNSIMVRTSYTNRHLTSAMQLLQYKQLINLQEGTECGTEEECNFIAKLITNIREDNVEYVCKIITIVLCLNTSSIVSKAEHLIQQIFSDINLPLSHCDGEPNDTDGDVKSSRTLLSFRLCESILDAVIQSNNKISLPFLETPLENVLSSCDDELKIHFLTRTVQRLVEAVAGYNILDRIWNHLKLSNVNRENALKTLSCLSEFYLPVPDSKGNVKFESEIVLQYEFWSLLLYGMMSNDLSVRKLSVYLTKRGIDCVIILKQDLTVNSEDYPIFTWEHKSGKILKEAWDNFFVLTDSLEEKQSNIVLPSLQLFESIHLIPHCWLNCAFNIGLKHDNTQVRCKCIEYRLNAAVTSETDALILLEALNDISIYDNENELLKQKLSRSFEHIHTFINVFRVIAKVKWSPIPFYHLTNVLCDIKLENISYTMKQREIIQIITDILKVPCNNIAIRKAVHVNISFFVGKCFKNLNWKDLVNIYLAFNVDILNTSSNPLVLLVEHLSLNEYEKIEFFQCIGNSYQMIDFILLYLSKHEDDHKVILNIITEKIGKIQDIVNRQYSNKVTCLNDIIFLIHLFSKTDKADGGFKETINTMIGREYKIILQYVTCLLSSDTNLNNEEIYVIFKEFSLISSLNDSEVKETLLQLYKSALLLLNDNNTELDKKVVSIYVYNNLSNNPILVKEYKHEMLSLKHFLEIMKKTEFNVNIYLESTGRLRNVFYEKSCEIVHCLLKEQKEIKRNMKELINFIETVIECGGYGCLKWILRIMNDVLPLVLNDSEIDFNVAQFINRMWKEIEELKSNNQYFPCIEEFVNLITQIDLLNQPMYNNIVMCYSNKILEYGPVKNTPLFCLVKKLNSMNTTVEYSQIVYAICEILLYSPVPRKDQRIMDNLSVEILHNPKYCLNMTEINIHFNFEIQYLSISTLCNIVNQEMIETITSCIINKINDNFKNKQRYHGNSQPHRLLLTGLQHLLLLNLLNLKSVEDEKTIQWVIELLGKLPHQPSVRICLEWYIALHIYLKKINLNEDLLKLMKSKNVPLTSQFIIIYWVTKHQISNGTCKKDEYEFVMDTLLSHTMGQMFNIRLHAQYLATRLSGINLKNSQKYAYTIEVIEKTFIESEKDKNFVRLREDLFINDFDIVSHLTPCFIYYFLPKYCDVGSNETVDETYVRNILRNIQESMNINDFNTDFKVEWTLCHKSDEEIFNYSLRNKLETNKTAESADMQGTIQKKYIPWKNMSDIDVFEADKKRECSSELIVVASLIDKLPNLGGMARTSEVFGVKTYVVDSLRHLQDKQFQGLSVSAERWVNIEEVRPGQPLKDYLIKKKAEGYIVVAAEQTSTSCQLQAFKFPKKTLLLLGHEKEGIPCDLLPMMDHCVEIPQQGFVRSLNVHVTAAIFVWEYSRQNIL